MNDVPVVTVDGPSGTGKGTVCSNLAKRLGWHLLDSGALYRLLALSALNKGIELEDESVLADLARTLDVEFSGADTTAESSILLEGENVSEDIRSEQCGNAASHIAARPTVREALLQRQRDFQKSPGLVADGRDMGTVVFPRAPLKVYLTASPEERAQRRYKQLKAKGISVNLARLSADIAERDARDLERKASPLKPAKDAVLIDTTTLSIEAVNQQIEELVRTTFPGI